jgi:hypothetical protein
MICAALMFQMTGLPGLASWNLLRGDPRRGAGQ